MATELNGSTQYLSAANNAALLPGSDSFSLSIWLNPSALPPANGTANNSDYKQIVDFGGYANGIFIRLGPANLTAKDDLWVGGAYYNWQPFNYVTTTGSWYHLAVVRSGNSLTVSVNNQQTLSASSTESVSSSQENRIGQAIHANGSNYSGTLAELAFWKGYGLTAAEVTALSKGIAAPRVRARDLSFYAPLIRNLQDVRGGLTITNNNGATVANHPRLFL